MAAKEPDRDPETFPLLQNVVEDSLNSNYRSINRPNESLNYTNHSTRSADSRWTLQTVPGQVTLDEQQLLQLSEALKTVQDIIFAAQHSSSRTHRRRYAQERLAGGSTPWITTLHHTAP